MHSGANKKSDLTEAEKEFRTRSSSFSDIRYTGVKPKKPTKKESRESVEKRLLNNNKNFRKKMLGKQSDCQHKFVPYLGDYICDICFTEFSDSQAHACSICNHAICMDCLRFGIVDNKTSKRRSHSQPDMSRGSDSKSSYSRHGWKADHDWIHNGDDDDDDDGDDGDDD